MPPPLPSPRGGSSSSDDGYEEAERQRGERAIALAAARASVMQGLIRAQWAVRSLVDLAAKVAEQRVSSAAALHPVGLFGNQQAADRFDGALAEALAFARQAIDALSRWEEALWSYNNAQRPWERSGAVPMERIIEDLRQARVRVFALARHGNGQEERHYVEGAGSGVVV